MPWIYALTFSPALPAGFIVPCLPTLARTVPTGPKWTFELKHDGLRFVCGRDGDRVHLFSRHGKDRQQPKSGGNAMAPES